jgi:RNA polymerase sigma-70 factor, ECF subfamily
MPHIPVGYHATDNSERLATPGASRIPSANPSDKVSVSIRLCQHPDVGPSPNLKTLAATPLNERRSVSREGFAEGHRPAQADIDELSIEPHGVFSTIASTVAPLDYAAFDADYLTRLRQGDPETERHFIAYFSSALWFKLRNRVRLRYLIDEIQQETFARVLKYLQSGKPIQYPERFGGFVQAVCNHVMLEVLRSEFAHRQTGEGAIDPPDHRVKFDTDIVTDQRKQAVRDVLSEMAEKDRTLLTMVFLQEGDRSEICKRFKVDGDYLRVLLHRAKERFRDIVRKKRGFAVILQ